MRLSPNLCWAFEAYRNGCPARTGSERVSVPLPVTPVLRHGEFQALRSDRRASPLKVFPCESPAQLIHSGIQALEARIETPLQPPPDRIERAISEDFVVWYRKE